MMMYHFNMNRELIYFPQNKKETLMKKPTLIVPAVLILCMLLPYSVFAGYAITQSASSMHGQIESKVYIQKDKYKTEREQSQMIVNFARDRVVVTNDNDKTYWEGTLAQYIRALSDMQAASMKKMNEVLKKMPEAERKQIMEMHGMGTGNKPVTVDVQKTGQTDIIAGYKAEKFIINANSSPFEELWLAQGIKISGEIDPEKLHGFIAQMQKNKMGGSTQGKVGMSKAYINLLNQGYPVKQVFSNNMTVTVESVKEITLPDKLFEIPAGYKRAGEIQQLFMGGHGTMN